MSLELWSVFNAGQAKIMVKLQRRFTQMGRLFDFPTGSSSVDVTVSIGSSLSEEQRRALEESAALNKRATQQKKAGDFKGAIASVKVADRALVQAGFKEDRAGSMRLAMLLHKAGRRDAAWAEFNRMILGASSGNTRVTVPMSHSETYDKMRLCLQREGKHAEAVVLAVLSYCCRCLGLYLQSRTDLPAFFGPLVSRKWLLPGWLLKLSV